MSIDPMLRLHRAAELAKELGVPTTFVRDMKSAGFPMPGYRSNVTWALEWLRANPDFSQSRTRYGVMQPYADYIKTPVPRSIPRRRKARELFEGLDR